MLIISSWPCFLLSFGAVATWATLQIGQTRTTWDEDPLWVLFPIACAAAVVAITHILDMAVSRRVFTGFIQFLFAAGAFTFVVLMAMGQSNAAGLNVTNNYYRADWQWQMAIGAASSMLLWIVTVFVAFVFPDFFCSVELKCMCFRASNDVIFCMRMQLPWGIASRLLFGPGGLYTNHKELMAAVSSLTAWIKDAAGPHATPDPYVSEVTVSKSGQGATGR